MKFQALTGIAILSTSQPIRKHLRWAVESVGQRALCFASNYQFLECLRHLTRFGLTPNAGIIDLDCDYQSLAETIAWADVNTHIPIILLSPAANQNHSLPPPGKSVRITVDNPYGVNQITQALELCCGYQRTPPLNQRD